jgi:fructosamine-3-kinase
VAVGIPHTEGGALTPDSAGRIPQELALMHRHTSANGKHGFDIKNTIGATPQVKAMTKSLGTCRAA